MGGMGSMGSMGGMGGMGGMTSMGGMGGIGGMGGGIAGMNMEGGKVHKQWCLNLEVDLLHREIIEKRSAFHVCMLQLRRLPVTKPNLKNTNQPCLKAPHLNRLNKPYNYEQIAVRIPKFENVPFTIYFHLLDYLLLTVSLPPF